MNTLLLIHLERAFGLTLDLVESLSQESLTLRLGDLPSNTIGEQLWCMIGTRESYLNALVAGKWKGFGCSLSDTTSKELVIQHLNSSAHAVIAYMRELEKSAEPHTRIVELLEHEVMHHGQLIRYVYGNKLSFPQSWDTRYTV